MRNIKYVVYKEGKYYVSQCLNVDVSSFGIMFLSLYSLSCLRWKQGFGANGGSP